MSWQRDALRGIRLAVPLELFKWQDPASSERTFTENVSSEGVRVLARRMGQPREQLMVSFLEGNLRTQAQVVHCQRLLNGRFGIGLQLP
jgi:hypothetical protein